METEDSLSFFKLNIEWTEQMLEHLFPTMIEGPFFYQTTVKVIRYMSCYTRLAKGHPTWWALKELRNLYHELGFLPNYRLQPGDLMITKSKMVPLSGSPLLSEFLAPAVARICGPGNGNDGSVHAHGPKSRRVSLSLRLCLRCYMPENRFKGGAYGKGIRGHDFKISNVWASQSRITSLLSHTLQSSPSFTHVDMSMSK